MPTPTAALIECVSCGHVAPATATRCPCCRQSFAVDHALALARTFRLPLPPPVNHRTTRGTTFGGRRNVHLSAEARAWAAGAALIVGAWRPPARTWLTVRIALAVPPSLLHRLDVDSCLKPLIDATVGHRRDQWVRRLLVEKRPGDGWAEVWVAPDVALEDR